MKCAACSEEIPKGSVRSITVDPINHGKTHYHSSCAWGTGTVKCAVCGRPIGGEADRFILVNGTGRHYYHPACLLEPCAWCGEKIARPGSHFCSEKCEKEQYDYKDDET